MGTVTYPDASVIAALAERFVACRIESAKAPDLARKMNVRWLPGLVVSDAEERPAHVQIGFLPPADLPSAEVERLVSRTPLRRSVPVEDVVSAAFLLSTNRSVTGQILSVDGGLLAHHTAMAGIRALAR